MPINRWDHRLQLGDVFHNEDMPFEQRRDEIVRRIKAARFYRTDDRSLSLDDIVDELADAEDYDEFDDAWDSFYDYADVHRIWVETISLPAST